MSIALVIPARQGSSRFPGKPHALIRGKEMLLRTWQIARSVRNVDQIYIATDHDQIETLARKFGAQVIRSTRECENGTERVFDAIQQLPQHPEIIINLQGDAVLTPPWIIEAVADAMKKDPEIQIGTPATHLNWDQYEDFVQSKTGGRTSGTLVVFDRNFSALYFSKGLIPFVRNRKIENPPLYRHIGLYGYRYAALKKYQTLSPTPLEQMEGLEQLRALENGIPIRIIPGDYRGRTHWSVDDPQDIAYVEKIIEKEGELACI